MSIALRRRRARALKAMIEAVHRAKGEVRILDLGGRVKYWRDCVGLDWLVARRVRVTLLNLPGEAGEVASGDPIFVSVEGDALRLPEARTRDFDLAHANSVIEHVGAWENVEAFAAVMRRFPRFYCQTPYFWFPIEPHYRRPFIHWLPEGERAKILMRGDLAHFRRAVNMREAMEGARLIPLLNRMQMRALFPDAEHRFEWFVLPKSIVVVKGAP